MNCTGGMKKACAPPRDQVKPSNSERTGPRQ
jgi:hypothetical protein